ncbi:MAG: cytochrome c [Gemmatimonadaceae bacterium]
MNGRRLCIGLLLVGACRAKENEVLSEDPPATYGLGRTATPAEIAAIDIDANSAGVGLPAGEGTADAGAPIYAQKCASCHGAKGEGIDKNPKLIGREPPAGFVFASDAKVPKTIGNYWPYATTLYDYIHRAMPLNVPGSLTPTETYSLVAYLLRENGIPTSATINAKSLADVKMPAQPRFVKDNRTGGATFR